ncbi:hypothetical protein EMIHUDRAFT_457848 [Emiliania huxleyi CCMP1516]|uniref:PH domain-containing protein n=2 Tax=Emiliania huxleyi TaxID=2903 RepID=A0A0D3JK12_EMIH1|nr:hypothetical protein EMIHUDRAFT_457848 [Emiliania huxleyi CCMP1516]EOD23847.1 hypothetical protein EMIHUDRAFT_457848 [Emiliania huxleyi CCMP1516]|eukprot:XP_005776276.1 hypothetical protein EMIHUDRAFT_457848 [Emiliania huxleyi CCMP1516]
MTRHRLRVGDVILAVDGERLKGRRPAEVMEALQRESYELLVATPPPTDEDEATGRVVSLPQGDIHGWLEVTPARIRAGRLAGTAPPFRAWVVVADGDVSFYEEEEVKRASKLRVDPEKRIAQPLLGAAARPEGPAATEAEKKAEKKAERLRGMRARAIASYDEEDEDSSREENRAASPAASTGGGSSRTSPVGLRAAGRAVVAANAVAKKAAAANVVEAAVARGVRPLKLSWPGKVDAPVYILGASTGDERAKWVDALGRAAEEVAERTPTYGTLAKRKGRRGGAGGGVLARAVMGSWSDRWFELQPKGSRGDETAPTLAYYESADTAQAGGQAVAKGLVALNKDALLVPAAAGDKVHPHAFSITSQAEEDASPVTTLLAAASEEERTRWVTAIARAIRSCQPQPERTAKFQPASKEEAVLYQKSALQLRLLLEYMSIPASRFRGAEEDKPRLVALVMQGRVARKMAAAAADTAEAVEERVRLEREERARLEARTIDELWALLDYMEVEYDEEEAKGELVARIVAQKTQLMMRPETLAPLSGTSRSSDTRITHANFGATY